ncbi:MAG TPA: c-type cytochrome [Burkholderiales bacterium]|nr:c-type cytochrome [Burkholderiales bacterium]
MKSRKPPYPVVLAAVLSTALLSAAGPALAQPAQVQPPPGEEMRALSANPAEVAEGKRIAQAQCAGCHGPNGLGASDAIPNIAGQRAAYLYLELQVYQAGGRGENMMANAVRDLSRDALYKVAAYYASLDPAQPAAAKRSPRNADPLQSGQAAAAPCADCHGAGGVSQTAGTPSLAALDPKYLAGAMAAYKTGKRKDEVMKSIAGLLPARQLDDVALYFALQKPARARTPASGDAAAGRQAAEACAGCHGDKGVSSSPANPSLAGQDAGYLAAALRAYKSGARSDETMKGIAEALDDAAMRNLAAYYAGEQPQPANVRRPLSTAQWVERCDRCHGLNGNSTDPRIPALAAQHERYLATVLQAYRTGARKSSAMAAMAGVLSEADVESLAEYYARQKARAVVYVVVPR